MGNKRKVQKITKVSIRQRGFGDGYSGAKNVSDSYISKLLKQGIGKEELVEMIKEYNVGYKVGVLANKDLNNIQVRDNKEYYNGKAIVDTIHINRDGIIEQAELRKRKKRRR